MPLLRAIRHSGEAVRPGRRGVATIEFALVAPILLLLLGGVLDFAMLLRTATCASDAAHAGASYGSYSASTTTDYTGMQNAAISAAPSLTGMTASASRFCQCTNGTSISCAGSCANGKMLLYVQVTTQGTATTIFKYKILNFSGTVNGKATMRAQ